MADKAVIRILNAEPFGYSNEARRVLQSVGELHESALTREGLVAALDGFEALIVRLGFRIDRRTIDAGCRLRAIVTATTGLDHIDVRYAEEKGVRVLSLKGEIEFLRSIPATAEHTWALLLALTRRIPQAFASVCRGEWERDAFRGHDLCGKRLGIVGLGRIGERVARYAMAFGMSVKACDPYRREWVPGVGRADSLHDLLKDVDVLSLHVPLNDETRHLLGARELEMLPSTSVVVNTSRGAVTDEEALLSALGKKQIAGAALDVIEDENSLRDFADSPLVSYARCHDNLLITPHLGGATAESMSMTEVFMAHKLKSFLESCS